MADQAARLLYCYLREKWTTLAMDEQENPERAGLPFRGYQCLGADDACVGKRCRLADDTLRAAGDARDPWFDE